MMMLRLRSILAASRSQRLVARFRFAIACIAIPLAVAFPLAHAVSAAAATLVINANTADPTPRAAWEGAVQRFQLENPDVRVELNTYDHESYKKSLRNWLTSTAPDVVFWFAG